MRVRDSRAVMCPRDRRQRMGADLSPHPFMARYPQHIHCVPTGPILGMRERSHGLAAQPFTGTKNPPV
jgi:hypothetical protein